MRVLGSGRLVAIRSEHQSNARAVIQGDGTMEFPTKRICQHCPELSWEKHELAAHADHLATHNPSPAEWTEAYKRIQAGKLRAKQSE